MASVIDKLRNAGLIDPPRHMKTNVQYETLMGSIAYGCNTDDSDWDIYGFTIPYKNIIFPHIDGHIEGFGKKPTKFNVYNPKHIKFEKREYDFDIFNIIKYFQLLMDNNPNIIDSIFTPQRCVLHCTQVGNHIRDNRKKFLHKGCFLKLKGYMFSQIKKMRDKNPEIGSKRHALVLKYGFDCKYASHAIRLINQAEQILTEGDLDLERNSEQLKAIRRGEWTVDEIIDYANNKERDLETVYSNSTLPWGPDEPFIKNLLLECLEMHFGSLERIFPVEHNIKNLLSEMEEIINKYRRNE